MTHLFTNRDIEIVRGQINLLPKYQAEIIRLRFWEHRSIEDIAWALRREWDDVYAALKVAMERLLLGCIKQRAFSRRLPGKRRKARTGHDNSTTTSEVLDR